MLIINVRFGDKRIHFDQLLRVKFKLIRKLEPFNHIWYVNFQFLPCNPVCIKLNAELIQLTKIWLREIGK